jgi:hypothetical protein
MACTHGHNFDQTAAALTLRIRYSQDRRTYGTNLFAILRVRRHHAGDLKLGERKDKPSPNFDRQNTRPKRHIKITLSNALLQINRSY